jgi:hypothetical protein
MAECTKFKEHYITIDSSQRNRTLWPSPSQFRVYLTSNISYDDAPEDNRYDGVRQVEVIDVQFPNKNHVISERYIYLCIPEIGGSLDATETVGANALGKLIPSRLIGAFVQVHFEVGMRPKKTFDFSGLALNAMTVELRKKDGTLFQFGTDTTPPNPILPELQTSITLRILTQW